MLTTVTAPVRLFSRLARRELALLRDQLRQETVGGALLLIAALVALILANSPWHLAYERLSDLRIGPSAWHLDLTAAQWAADGFLALFFLVAGIELKRELVAGQLRDPRRAVLPVAAAVAGVVLPAALYAGVVTIAGAPEDRIGWAIPTATDIAFALAVLAVIGSHLPVALRSFLLTLAVVDDLIAIVVIAVFYNADLRLLTLAAAAVPVALWALALRRGWTNPLLLGPLALSAWALVHASGVHATVAGVLLGLSVPVAREVEDDPDRRSLAERLEHRLRPLSAGVAVPVFAFFAAGVRVVDGTGGTALTDPVFLGVVVGLVAGKAFGVFGGTWLVARFTRADLDDDLSWVDIWGLSALAGVGFTVSLLVGELAFGPGSSSDVHARLGVIVGSLIAAGTAWAILRGRNTHYREIDARVS